MICNIKMVDTDTGEIIACTSVNYVFNLSMPKDAGFACLRRWLESCVKGTRVSEHHNMTLQFSFSEPARIPLGYAPEQVIKESTYVY